MVFIPVINTMAATLIHEFLNQRYTNTIYVRQDNPVTPADLGDIADSLVNLWIQNVMPRLSNQARLVGVSVRDLSAQNGIIFDYTGAPLPASGGTAGTPLPSSVAVVVSLRTGRAGRSFRGRLYLGGFSETQSDGNFFFQNLPTLLANGVTAVLLGLTTGSRVPVVVSKYSEGNPRSVGVTTPITGVAARTVRVATQRRRLPNP
jgi:hypothetical protein